MEPHGGQPVETVGPPLGEAPAVMILVHGRGGSARGILELATHLAHPSFTYLAPQAAGHTWYPFSFMAQTEDNEPGISSGLDVLKGLVERVVDAGIGREKIVLAGFSQGACLSSEFAVRHAARFGGVLAFSGGLIGPPGTTWPYDGSFEGMPAFFGCSDVDAHVPKERVDESAEVFEAMGAAVEKRIYPGMPHTIIEDELVYARTIVEAVGG